MKKISLILLMAFIGMSLQQVRAQSMEDTAGHVIVKNKIKGHKVKTKLKGTGAGAINASTPKPPAIPATVIVTPPQPATVINNPQPTQTVEQPSRPTGSSTTTHTETTISQAPVKTSSTVHSSKTVATKTTHTTAPVHHTTTATHHTVYKKKPADANATTVKTSTTVTKTNDQ